MIYFVGAGSGAPDLITVRGARLLSEADVIVYAGSLVNPALLDYKKDGCEVYNSAKMTLEEVIAVMAPAAKAGKTVVRLHTGDPCVYGAHREQMDELDRLGLAYEVCPGVSAGQLARLSERLIAGGYAPDTPAAIVYKATWPDEKVVRTTVADLAEAGAREGITKTALITVGGFLGTEYERSKLYDPTFTTEFREASR